MAMIGSGIGLFQTVAAIGGSSVSGATPFNSLGISTFGWWTADQAADINTGSSSVWAPHSGTAGPLTQITSTMRGTYSSGPPAKLSFDSDDNLLTASPPTAYDALAVITTNSSSATWRTMFWCAAGSHALILESGTNRMGVYGTPSGAFNDSGLTIAPSTMALVHVRVDSTGNVSQSLNGGTITGTIGDYSAMIPADRAINVAGSNSGGGQPVGDVHAIAISGSGPWSSGDLNKAVGCLAWEWWGSGAILPIGHPYKSVAP